MKSTARVPEVMPEPPAKDMPSGLPGTTRDIAARECRWGRMASVSMSMPPTTCRRRLGQRGGGLDASDYFRRWLCRVHRERNQYLADVWFEPHRRQSELHLH